MNNYTINHRSTVLVVDDTEANIDILIRLLSGYDVIVALNGPAALDILREERVDIVLLDIVMPGMDGYEVCRIMKEDAALKEIPVLFITARSDEESIEKAFDIGGADYVTKPFKPKELMARLKTQLNLKDTLKALKYQATRDPMTGIYNRRHFFELGNRLFAQTPDHHFFAVMMDLDKFKCINDTYGHDFGDEVIKLFAVTVQQYLNPSDIFGRLGGEEFALLCQADYLNKIMKRMEIIRKAVKNCVLFHEKKRIQFTVSKGVGEKSADTTRLDHVLKKADLSLYEAKRSGRNRVIFRSSQRLS